MGLLDGLLSKSGGLGGIAKLAAENPQAVAAILSLLSSRDSSIGGTGGLGSVIEAFQKKGLGDLISGWIADGPNPGISEGQVTDIFGSEVIKQFGAKAGVPENQAGGLLASLLPAVVDHLTPDGKVPEAESLESSLGGLLGGLLR